MPTICSPRKIKFAGFEVDCQEQELFRNGIRLKLGGQPFQVLMALLDHPAGIVTRETLCRRLWPQDSFVDFDNSLNAAVNRLREVLGDSPDKPRFIETVPRRGYRFIAEVQVVEEEEKPVPEHDPARAGGRTFLFRSGYWLAAATTAILIVFLTLSLRRPPRLTEGDQILLADFANSTQDSAFDDVLKPALAVQLEQSPLFNIIPAGNLRETLKRMSRSPEEALTGEVAREACEREGAKVMISGSIGSLGKNYVITLAALNCRTGEPVMREQVEVEAKEQVLRAIERTAIKIRRKLGESLASIQRYDAPIEKASTPSLEALKFFSLGTKQRDNGDENASIALFKRAIEVDPDFALAYARLGQVYRNLENSEEAERYATRAYQLRGGVSERERLYIDSRYYSFVTGEQQKEIETYEVWTKTYPGDIHPYLFLAGIYRSNGQWPKAAELANKALLINPRHPFPRVALGSAELGMNHFQQARAIVDKPSASTVWTPALLYKISFAEGDAGAMRRHVESSAGKPEEVQLMFSVAAGEAAGGKLRSARRLFQQATRATQALNSTELSSRIATSESLIEALAGNRSDAKKKAEELAAQRNSPGSRGYASWVYAAIGETSTAQEMADTLARSHPRNTYLNFVWLPLARAEIQSGGGNAPGALAELETVRPFELGAVAGFLPVFIRGRVYLQAHQYNEAVQEFQRILAHRGVDPTSILYVLSHLYLGRTYALMGEKEKSREAYQQFLTLWKDADPGVPILQEANAEYAKLK